MKLYLNPSKARTWFIRYETSDGVELPPATIEARYWQEALEFFWAGQDEKTFLALPNDIEIEFGSSLAKSFTLWVDAGNGRFDLCTVQDITPNDDVMISCENVVKQRLSKDEKRKRKK